MWTKRIKGTVASLRLYIQNHRYKYNIIHVQNRPIHLWICQFVSCRVIQRPSGNESILPCGTYWSIAQRPALSWSIQRWVIRRTYDHRYNLSTVLWCKAYCVPSSYPQLAPTEFTLYRAVRYMCLAIVLSTIVRSTRLLLRETFSGCVILCKLCTDFSWSLPDPRQRKVDSSCITSCPVIWFAFVMFDDTQPTTVSFDAPTIRSFPLGNRVFQSPN